MGRPLLDWKPCQDCVLDDVCGGFAMGAVGGSAYHFLKGLRHSPHGTRIAGGMEAMRMNAPRVGGNLATYAGLYSAFDCTLAFMRQKEDPWNSINAGAAAGGFYSLRKGLGATGRSALVGGAIFALIEGVRLMNQRIDVMLQNLPPLPADDPDPNLAAAIAAGGGGYQGVGGFPSLPQQSVPPIEVGSSSGGGGWFGGLFSKDH